MATTRGEFIITIATLITLLVGGAIFGYDLGKNSPCTQTESIDIKPIQ